MTWLITHPACLAHDPGPGHPEHAGRLSAILERLREDHPDLSWYEPPLASEQQLSGVHDAATVSTLLKAVPASGRVAVDADTVLSSASGEAARAAAGAALMGVGAVLDGAADNVFCAVRPPGHHAESHRAMGFCLFNSIAVAAHAALARPGCTRVSIVDFDVHHGNGTQEIFCANAQVQYLSTHQMPLYPGTGARDERGVGNIVNVPLTAGSGSETFRAAIKDHWLPALEGFAPDLLLISAGFDAHRDDPLAGLNLDTEDYRWVTEQLMEVAAHHCRGRIVSALEGGYNTTALAESVSTHVGVLSSA